MTAISRRRLVTTLAGGAGGVVAGVPVSTSKASSNVAKKSMTQLNEERVSDAVRRMGGIDEELVRRMLRLNLPVSRAYRWDRSLKQKQWKDFSMSRLDQDDLEKIVAGLETSSGFKPLPRRQRLKETVK